jgi:hypothetical protein
MRDLHSTYTLGSSGDWNTLPKDRDEVNRREVSECDGWVCDRDAQGAPSIFKVIRSTEVLTRMLPILDLNCGRTEETKGLFIMNR